MVLPLFRPRFAQGDLLASEPKQAETEPLIGGGAWGTGCCPLFQTRFAQGDLLASEPKQAETEQGIALQMGLFQCLV
jgi:hypothetical protein